MKKILFICQGNVGRSQIAEGYYNHYKGNGASISAGIDDIGEKYNYVPRADIIQVMQEKGLDISTHKIKQINKDILKGVENIVVLCKAELLPDFVTSSGINIQFREVPDPFESSIDGVRKIRDEIEAIVLEMVQAQ